MHTQHIYLITHIQHVPNYTLTPLYTCTHNICTSLHMYITTHAYTTHAPHYIPAHIQLTNTCTSRHTCTHQQDHLTYI